MPQVQPASRSDWLELQTPCDSGPEEAFLHFQFENDRHPAQDGTAKTN